MTLKLQDMLQNEAVFEVSFFNFENSITAAYFADRDLNIIRANKNFQALFPSIKKFEGLNMLFLLDKLGLSQERIDEFSRTLTKENRVQIPDLKITVQGKMKTYSLLSTYTKNENFSYLNGVQGQLIDRTAEYELHAQNQQLLEENKKSNTLLTEKSEKLETIANRLAKYLSPQVYQSIFSDKIIDGQTYKRKNLTVFFSDIASFTDLSDTLEPERLAELINTYLSDMTEIAISNGGTIDKFIGDAIMVFFGDPDSSGEEMDALRCLKMAFEMQEKIKSISRVWQSKRGIPGGLNVRMGIATGYCTVGNFGSNQRLDYTALGSPVNMAARLETICPLGEVLMTQATANILSDKVKSEFFDDFNIKGFSKPIPVYKGIALENIDEELETGLVHQSDSLELYIKKSSDIVAVIRELRELEQEFSKKLSG
ncbi:MAG: adenylate/guanylate cyclase domain-containing protein [Paracoccaceae bacterium]